MKREKVITLLILVAILMVLMGITKRCSAELYIAAGAGVVGYNDLVDYDNESVHGDPIGRVRVGWRHQVGRFWSINAEAAHMSSIPADDGGNNWAGIELEWRWR